MMRWVDATKVIHGVIEVEAVPRPKKITLCWQPITTGLPIFDDGHVTCLFCMAYEERARAWG